MKRYLLFGFMFFVCLAYVSAFGPCICKNCPGTNCEGVARDPGCSVINDQCNDKTYSHCDVKCSNTYGDCSIVYDSTGVKPLDCLNGLCYNSNTINVTIGYADPGCPDVKYVFFKGSYSDGSCEINASLGIGTPRLSLTSGSRSFTYTLPKVSSACSPKNISAFQIMLSNSSSLDSAYIFDTYSFSDKGSFNLSNLPYCDHILLGYCNGTVGNVYSCAPITNSATCGIKTGCSWVDCTAGDRCGDGKVETPNYLGQNEECDDGNNIDTDMCSNSCTRKKPVGWTTADWSGWQLNEDDTITCLKEGSALVTNYYLSLKPNTRYTMSASVSNPTTCHAYLDLDDGHCYDTSTNERTAGSCWNDETDTTLLFPQNTGGFVSQSQNISIVLPSTSPYISSGYVKMVRLRLVVDTCTPSEAVNVVFDNVSLKETSYIDSNIHYDRTPQIQSTNACCPNDWCWNGTECVNSYDWMSNSSYAPVWNDILNSTINPWSNEHVNSTNISESIGYRCIADNSGYASWTPATIKYDWNFEHSGYCNRITDCFVNAEFKHDDDNITIDSKQVNVPVLGNCIRDGESVNDDATTGGNHYCDSGTWTTRSAMVADVLINLSKGLPYVLLCDRDLAMVFNNHGVDEENISAACTIVINDTTFPNERVITGIVLTDEKHANEVDGLLSNIKSTYASSQYLEPGMHKIKMNTSLDDCAVMADKIYLKCSEENNLSVYYNNVSKFFLISNKPIVGVEPKSFFQNILGFFANLFGSSASSTIVHPSAINRTSNFDKVFIVGNRNDITSSGVEETKYDEFNETKMTYLYVEYHGTTSASNPLDELYIQNYLKNYGINGEKLTPNTKTQMTQTFIIKTEKSTGLWPYLTAMLRLRDLPKRVDK